MQQSGFEKLSPSGSGLEAAPTGFILFNPDYPLGHHSAPACAGVTARPESSDTNDPAKQVNYYCRPTSLDIFVLLDTGFRRCDESFGSNPDYPLGQNALDRVELTGLRRLALPHHRTCGFPHPAVEFSG